MAGHCGLLVAPFGPLCYADAGMHALRSALLRLPDNVRAALWTLIAGSLFSLMGALVKHLGGTGEYESFQLAFFRALFGLLAVLPFLLRLGRRAVHTKRLGLHLLRSFCGASALMCGFYALSELSLADAVSLSYARPLFLIPLAVLFLGEIVRLRRWSATAIGFIGVIVMLRPTGSVEFAALIALLGALLVAIAMVFVKKLTVTERPETMLFYSGTVASLATLLPALAQWRTPDLPDFLLMVATGATGAAAQYCSIRAYRVGEATAIIPFDYVRLLFAGVIGYVVFFETPDRWTVIGAAIVVASTLYIGLREARLGARRRAAAREEKS